MITYFIEHYDLFAEAFLEHLWIVFVTLLISLIIAAVLTIVLMKVKILENVVTQIFGIIYSIPSLALFAMLIPITGLGQTTAILVLVIYNQYLLLRNILAGMNGVDAKILEAAKGMGMSPLQVITEVQLPLAMPAILAGVRLAIISTTGIATIAATISAGGLGKVLFEGMRTTNNYKIIWGTILSAFIAWMADFILKKIELQVMRKTGGYSELRSISR